MTTKTTQPRRVLPADVFDTLELSALAFGGIGKGRYFDFAGDKVVAPVCIIGHGYCAASKSGFPFDHSDAEVILTALYNAGITVGVNDDAVGGDGSIDFPEWCKRLNVVRGDA